MNLQDFLRAATAAERETVARLIPTSVGQLYQIAGGHRGASADMALAIQKATTSVAEGAGDRLEPVPAVSLRPSLRRFEGMSLSA